MAQMAAATSADDLGALHAVANVLMSLDLSLADDIPEAGPARARVELGP